MNEGIEYNFSIKKPIVEKDDLPSHIEGLPETHSTEE